MKRICKDCERFARPKQTFCHYCKSDNLVEFEEME